MDEYLAAAIDQAKQGMETGGVPIGSVLVLDGVIVGRGHNRQMRWTVSTMQVCLIPQITGGLCFTLHSLLVICVLARSSSSTYPSS